MLAKRMSNEGRVVIEYRDDGCGKCTITGGSGLITEKNEAEKLCESGRERLYLQCVSRDEERLLDQYTGNECLIRPNVCACLPVWPHVDQPNMASCKRTLCSSRRKPVLRPTVVRLGRNHDQP
jgi:hypothetical protein